MAKRGAKPKRREVVWSPELAYAVGLIATDGNLSSDGRHLSLTSKDIEQLKNFMQCIGKKVQIGKKKSSYTGNTTTHVQFGDVVLYDFLLGIGLTPNKTKTIGALDIPDEYFFDFLRGHHDGDGSFYSYYDPRWRSSFMFYLSFISASRAHVEWIRTELERRLKVCGHLTASTRSSVIQLKYAKAEALKILKRMYQKPHVVCLSRKRLKIAKALRIVGESLPNGK
ncbi:MAG: hypothetical protein KGI41_02100 [Patescibacteria group bacterium]|nr:hypothetical protein [Patescibacteria group bacterium]MDE1966007.1 hypothetical protein [Patescibacteria group bacterium]